MQRLRGKRTEAPLGNGRSLSGSNKANGQGTQHGAGGIEVLEKGLQDTQWLPASHHCHPLKS